MESIDFLPERIRIQRTRRRRVIRLIYLVVICAGTLVLLALSRQRLVRKAQADVALLSERCEAMQSQLDLRRSLEKEQADLLIKKRIDDELGRRVGALDILAELGRLLPDNMGLLSLSMKPVSFRVPVAPVREEHNSPRAVTAAQARNKSVAATRVELYLKGIAPNDVSIANFIGQLSASPLFEDVGMTYAKNTKIKNRLAREFSVNCFVVP